MSPMKLYGSDSFRAVKKALSSALFAAVIATQFAMVPIDQAYADSTATVGQIFTFDTAGSTTWTAPTNVTSVKVKAWAGGGAGGNQSSGYAGQGGGAGGYAEATVSVLGGTDHTVVVGAGGVSTGTRNGGASSFDSSVSAAGGTGGAHGSETAASQSRIDTQCSFEGTWIYNDEGGPSSGAGANDFGVTCRGGKVTGFCNTLGTAAGMSRGLHAGNYVCEMGVTPEIGAKCDYDGTWAYADQGSGNDFAVTCRTGKVTGFCGATSLSRGNHPGVYSCEYGQGAPSDAPRCNFDGSWSYTDDGGGNDFAVSCRDSRLVGWCGATPLQRGGPQAGNYACSPTNGPSSTPLVYNGAGGAGVAGSNLQSGASAGPVSNSTPTSGGAAYAGGAGKGGNGASSGNGENGGTGRVTIEVVAVSGSGSADLAPVGFIDGASCSVIGGWSFDPNASSTSIMVHIYADSPAGSGTFVGAVLAADPRTDVNNANGISGNHAFSFATPSSLKDGQTHKIYAYGINTDSSGQNGSLPSSASGNPAYATLGPCTSVPPVVPVNLAPSTPTITGTSTGSITTSYSFSVISTDPEGDVVDFAVDWNDDGTIDAYSGTVASGQAATISNPANTWTTAGAKTFRVFARDMWSHVSSGKDFTIILSTDSGTSVNSGPNLAPIMAPTTGVVGTSYDFGASAVDPQGDDLAYGFDWNQSGTFTHGATVDSAVAQNTAHTFASPGIYTVTAVAKDIFGAVSNVQTHTITITAAPVTDNTAVGELDSASCSAFVGWSYDPDQSSVSNSVSFYADGPMGTGTHLGTIPTSVLRPDVNMNEGVQGDHGFSFPTPSTLKDGQTHQIYAYGLSTADSGLVNILGQAPMSITGCTLGGGGGSSNAAPSIPVLGGPATGTTSIAYDFTATATDPEGDQVRFGFDWDSDGTIEYTGFGASGSNPTISHAWSTAGAKTFKAFAEDSHGNRSGEATKTITLTFAPANLTPVVVSIVGNATGTVNTSYAFTATATDADGDDIEYGFDWNNSGAIETAAGEEWTPAVASGTAMTRSWIWTVGGLQALQVLARDAAGAIGSRSAAIAISGGPSDIGFTVTPTGVTTTSEAGGSAILSVVLNSAPLSNVTLGVMSSDFTEGTTSVTSLVFPAAQWNVPQHITVTGVDDTVADGAVAYTVTVGPSTSSDINFNNLPAQATGFTNFDDDGGSNGGGSGIISSFSISPSTILSGEDATLSWSSSGTQCVASGAWSGVKSPSGTENVGPFGPIYTAETRTFIIDCGGASGTSTATTTLTINPNSIGSTGGGGGGRSGGSHGGACIGNGCPTNSTTAPDIIIAIDQPPVAAPAVPTVGDYCAYDDFIASYMRIGGQNDPNEVKKLQYFLNTHDGASLAVDGVFDAATEDAVRAFQSRHADEVLAPWGVTAPTGIVYITTRAAINRIFCGQNPEYRSGDLSDILNPVPYTPVDNGPDFDGLIGSATTSTSTNLAGVIGAISGDILRLLKDIPWYGLLILLLLTVGTGLIVQRILVKDILSIENQMSFIQGLTVLAVGTVLDVLNTVSFMISPEWLTSRVGLSLNGTLGLDVLNLAAVLVIVISLLVSIHGRLSGASPSLPAPRAK